MRHCHSEQLCISVNAYWMYWHKRSRFIWFFQTLPKGLVFKAQTFNDFVLSRCCNSWWWRKINSCYWVCMWKRNKGQSCQCPTSKCSWQEPYKQWLPVQGAPEVTCQKCWEEVASSIRSCAFGDTCLLHGEGSQAGLSGWGHCWSGTAPELRTCTGTLCLPSSCKN